MSTSTENDSSLRTPALSPNGSVNLAKPRKWMNLPNPYSSSAFELTVNNNMLVLLDRIMRIGEQTAEILSFLHRLNDFDSSYESGSESSEAEQDDGKQVRPR